MKERTSCARQPANDVVSPPHLSGHFSLRFPRSPGSRRRPQLEIMKRENKKKRREKVFSLIPSRLSPGAVANSARLDTSPADDL